MYSVQRFVQPTLLGMMTALSTLSSLSSVSASPLLPYGSDTCIQGYVWREAGPRDRVCVRPFVRAQAVRDNALAPRRIQPGGGPYGAFTCRQGYVWREAFSGDFVCVTPDTRAQAAFDNSHAQSRFARNAY